MNEAYYEWKEAGEEREPLSILFDGTTLSVELDAWQAELIVESIRKAIPEFAEEGKHEIVGELAEIVRELSAEK